MYMVQYFEQYYNKLIYGFLEKLFTTKCETLPNKTLCTNIYKLGVKDTRKTTTDMLGVFINIMLGIQYCVFKYNIINHGCNCIYFATVKT